MKFKNKYIAIATFGVLSLASCNDYLEVKSPSQFDTDFVFSNSEDALKVLTGAYECFCEDPYTSRMSCVWMQNTDVEAMGPNAGVPNGGHRSDIWSLQASADASFSDVYKAWNNNYLAIDRANQVISGVKSSTISSDAEMQQILGEAYCLRAYRYFMLCNFWGDVPYFSEPAAYGQKLDKPKTDKNIIYTQCIQDLVNCEGNMKWSDINTGGIERMSRDFALGMISRLALFRAGYGMTKDGTMKKADDYLTTSSDSLTVTYTDINGTKLTASTSADYYKLAKNYCQKLIQLKPRPLRSNFAQIFKDECQYKVTNNDEVLYEVAYVESYGGDVGWCIGVPNTNALTKGNTTAQVFLSPTYYMSFNDNDTRRDATCALYSHDADTLKACSNSTNVAPAKWDRFLSTHDLGAQSSKGTGINWPLMRYSDVLLMLAEAENAINGPTDIAKNALKTVRARAFATSPNYSKDVTEYVDSVGENKDKFFNAVVDERAWEFGGECYRRFDLVRWNLYGDKINNVVKELESWAISTSEDLMNDPTVTVKYPDASKYAGWADNIYYKKSNGALVWLNSKYKLADDADVTGYTKVGWGAYMLKKVTSYTYNGTTYTTCIKATNNGVSTYTLDSKVTVTPAADGSTGIQQTITYEAGDYLTRMFRGYTGGGKEYGTGAVPYLLPIGSTTLSSSNVLKNDGYGFSSTYTGDDIYVPFATITKDYK